MYEYFAVGLGGFFGAMARFGLSSWINRQFSPPFHYGTLVVNVIGSFFLGALMFLAEERAALSPQAKLCLCVGFMGALTTFSTFGFETMSLIRQRELLMATANIGANVVLAVIAVLLGQLAIKGLGL